VGCGRGAAANENPRIGFLDRSTASGSALLLETFWQEFSKLGWIEEKSITIDYRFAEQKTERLPDLAADLVRLKVDLIVVSGRGPGLAAKTATNTIPIVMLSLKSPSWKNRNRTDDGSARPRHSAERLGESRSSDPIIRQSKIGNPQNSGEPCRTLRNRTILPNVCARNPYPIGTVGRT